MKLDLPESSFSFSEAIHISLANFRKRLGRTLITSLGIILGIAFFSALLTNSVLMQEAEAGGAIEEYRWWLVGISLLVTFVGITNAMLMSVTERTKEIGVYKTLGGMDKHILLMFTIEAGILGVFGGFIGSIVGILSSALLFAINPNFGIEGVSEAFLSNEPTFIPYLIIISVIISLVFTILASLYPAWRGARLDPAEALRFEI